MYLAGAQLRHGSSEPLCCLKTGLVKDFHALRGLASLGFGQDFRSRLQVES